MAQRAVTPGGAVWEGGRYMIPAMTEQWEFLREMHGVYQGARFHRTSYFERLAILDGGTVALAITAVLGPLHTAIRHKYTFGTGLTFLVAAMLTLLRRNYLAAKFEFYAASEATRDIAYISNPMKQEESRKVSKHIHYTEATGLWLSAIGIMFLLAEVWLILVS